ncbi:hypothetical protein [Alicyclobacillus acidoterrestris]|uniref:Uncharacterized protein n=1 Tax=Alicyclobacillus acidoterrestris (strain ATCC 49025 / DSM 3922 / CIP 106132 / NCIMB 13137 / GD3B) TaxID=1356854 RepID=T0DUF1_ALIAG|nr:hypothetical protein [Alicyclobacillus acidoterrestris]EPZ53081.1 hypothetical protein N007_18300 [Alicyclobacillus acidoterrestris ATCC 49025]UNO49381.1 hypothetical protein K1I37_02150 [Alicyclobacillus acidoterrestris]
MSTSVKAMDKVTVKQEPVGLVPEKMNRVASILEFRYGIRAIPLIDSDHDECQLVLQPIGEAVGTTYYFDMQEMLEVNVEREAARLAEFLASRATKCPKG